MEESSLIEVPITIKEQGQQAVIDSGSSLNVVSDDCVRKHHLHVVPCRQRIAIRLANGHRVFPDRQVTINATIGSEDHTIKALIIPKFPYDLLLGLDFILAAPVDILASKKEVRIGGSKFAIPPSFYRRQEEKLYCAEEVRLPPQSETIIALKGRSIKGWKEASVEGRPVLKDKYSVAMAGTLSNVRCHRHSQTVMARVMNTNDFPVKIPKRTLVATAHRIDNCFSLNHPQVSNEPFTTDDFDYESLDFGRDLSPLETGYLINTIREVGSDVFSRHEFDLGKTSIVKHHIDTGTAKPIKCTPYRTSFKERQHLSQLVEEMKTNGLVTDSTSPWAAPVVLVKKKDGSFRFCCDWRKLNAITKKDSMPLPRLDDTLDRLANAAYFTKLDFTCGYHQIELDDESKEKSAFTTPDGLFQFNVMGMGMCNAPATFQRLMYTMLGGLMWTSCMAYLDDIVIFSKDFATHVSDVKNVLIAIRKANLKIKPSKCSFAQDQIQYLGHIVSKEGILPDPQNLRAVADFPAPKNTQAVQQFLGLTGFYRRFVKGYATKSKPLTRLLKKDAIFEWLPQQQEAFIILRDNLLTAPILAHPRFDRPFIVSTDASNVGVGAVLKQKDDDGRIRVISYGSRSLSAAEEKYSATDKECLAIVFAIKKFRPYLYGTKFTIVTDHCSLCWLMRVKNPNGRLVRWSLALQDFDFDIEYESGRKHQDADALSRAPVDANTDGEEALLMLNSGRGSLEELQAKEEWLEPLLAYLKDPSLPATRQTKRAAHHYELEDGVVYRRVRTDGENHHLALVVPRQLRQEVLESLHDHKTAGHLGLRKTWQKIRTRFFWPKMFKSVQNYVLSCDGCNRQKVCHQPPSGLLQPLPPTSKPFERVGLDKLGPFPESIDGNKYIFVLTDYATRTVFAKAVAKGTAVEAAKFLTEDVLLHHGAPAVVITDRGREFVNCTFDAISTVYGFFHHKTTAYHPRTNGLTERFNKTLAEMIGQYVNQEHTDWDRFLPFLVFAYNTSANETTGYSPYFLLHGFEPKLGIELQLSQVKDVKDHFSFENIIYANRAREIATRRTEASQVKSKQRFDRHRQPTSYQVGDQVWIKRFARQVGHADKLLPSYAGPFRLVAQTAINDFLVENSNGKTDVVNVERFKPYRNRHQEPSTPERESILINPTAQQPMIPTKNDFGVRSSPQSELPTKTRPPIAAPSVLKRSGRIRHRPDRLGYLNLLSNEASSTTSFLLTYLFCAIFAIIFFNFS